MMPAVEGFLHEMQFALRLSILRPTGHPYGSDDAVGLSSEIY
jgi:hypothetical protein